MPAQNAERTVSLAVRSTLRALPSDAEILVLDDASTDSTADIITGIARGDQRVRLERSSRPVGVAAGLNVLLALATKPFVARMDADDITFPWRFRTQTKALQSGEDVVFSTRVNFGPTPASFRPAPLGGISATEMPFWLMLGNPVPHSSMATRRDLLVHAGGYRSSPAEDYELWLRLAADARRIARLRRPVLAYRMHAGQVTKTDEWRSRYVTDSALDVAHTALLTRAGWANGSVWSALARHTMGDGRATDKAELATLVDFLRHAVATFSPLARNRLTCAAQRLLG